MRWFLLPSRRKNRVGGIFFFVWLVGWLGGGLPRYEYVGFTGRWVGREGFSFFSLILLYVCMYEMGYQGLYLVKIGFVQSLTGMEGVGGSFGQAYFSEADGCE